MNAAHLPRAAFMLSTHHQAQAHGTLHGAFDVLLLCSNRLGFGGSLLLSLAATAALLLIFLL
jgi:hypothetical protein